MQLEENPEMDPGGLGGRPAGDKHVILAVDLMLFEIK